MKKTRWIKEHKSYASALSTGKRKKLHQQSGEDKAMKIYHGSGADMTPAALVLAVLWGEAARQNPNQAILYYYYWYADSMVTTGKRPKLCRLSKFTASPAQCCSRHSESTWPEPTPYLDSGLTGDFQHRNDAVASRLESWAHGNWTEPPVGGRKQRQKQLRRATEPDGQPERRRLWQWHRRNSFYSSSSSYLFSSSSPCGWRRSFLLFSFMISDFLFDLLD